MKKILVLCTGNSCRSQMAHGYLEFFAKSRLKIFSAGIEVHGVNQTAIKIMKEEQTHFQPNLLPSCCLYGGVRHWLNAITHYSPFKGFKGRWRPFKRFERAYIDPLIS